MSKHVLMLNRKIVDMCSKIEKEIGPDKIYSSFLVNATTSHDSVLEQYIDCVVRLVSSDFNHKSWNKSREFDICHSSAGYPPGGTILVCHLL